MGDRVTLPGDGAPAPAPPAGPQPGGGDFALTLPGGGTWHHFAAAGGTAMAAAAALGLPQTVCDQLFAAGPAQPDLVELDGGDLIILRAMAEGQGSTEGETRAFRLWIGRDRLVTFGPGQPRLVAAVARRIAAGRGPASLPALAVMILDKVTDGLRDAARALEIELDTCEEKVLRSPHATRNDELRRLRRRAILIRRAATPQADLYEELLRDPPAWLDRSLQKQVRHLVAASELTIQALDATREHVSSVRDQITLDIVERNRRTSQVLALLATVFLPLHLVAGLFGMNVGVPWQGQLAGFWVIIGGIGLYLALVAAIVLWLARGWPDAASTRPRRGPPRT
jgi:Mg2+ and Co2+ transporter CorA